MKPRFTQNKDDEFYCRLKLQVNEYLESANGSNVYKSFIFFKTFFGLSFLMAGYFFLIFGVHTLFQLVLAYVLIGLAISFVFLNVVHDAAHNCLFKNRAVNSAFVYILDLAGANSYLWKIRHVQLHHTYPNVPEWDVDIKQTGLVVLYDDIDRKPMHKYQYIYMVLLYFLYTLNWILYRDVKDMYGKYFAEKYNITMPKAEKVKFFFYKLFYFILFIYLPFMFIPLPWYNVIAGFFVLHLTQSAVAITALLSAHVDEHAVFPLPDAEGHMNNTWARHQLQTTSDFATTNPFVNMLYGGFNHHVAHHLFPNVCHVHYKKITELVKSNASLYGLPYKEMTMSAAIISHFKLLKRAGNH
jgi:linoleoyl-CoA desaturase